MPYRRLQGPAIDLSGFPLSIGRHCYPDLTTPIKEEPVPKIDGNFVEVDRNTYSSWVKISHIHTKEVKWVRMSDLLSQTVAEAFFDADPRAIPD